MCLYPFLMNSFVAMPLSLGKEFNIATMTISDRLSVMVIPIFTLIYCTYILISLCLHGIRERRSTNTAEVLLPTTNQTTG